MIYWSENIEYENIGGCLIWLRQTDPFETDMSETRALPFGLLWVRRLNHSLNWYDWDAKLTVDTNITETPRPDLAPIWLRHPIFYDYIYEWDVFYLWHTYDWDTLTNLAYIWLRRKCSYMTALQMPNNYVCLFYWSKFWGAFSRMKDLGTDQKKVQSLKERLQRVINVFWMWNSVTFGNNEPW